MLRKGINARGNVQDMVTGGAWRLGFDSDLCIHRAGDRLWLQLVLYYGGSTHKQPGVLV